jgi:protein-L-isoaspartate(D-aspartate) O-methyltransferase
MRASEVVAREKETGRAATLGGDGENRSEEDSGMTSRRSGLRAADDQRNWLSNGGFSQGEASWEKRPPGQATIDPAEANGRPAVLLERAAEVGEPAIWCQQVTGLPERRHALLTARVRVLEGEAYFHVRCHRADGAEIAEFFCEWSSVRPTVAGDWHTYVCSFVVPADAAAVEVGAMLFSPARAWFTDFALRLVPDEDAPLRALLVEKLVREGTMPTAACRRAFLRVPRHRFLPNFVFGEAYLDVPIATHFHDQQGRRVPISSSSQPTVMALMLGQLRLRPGLRVLEIGAGTGFNAAILAEIVGAENVVSIDLDAEIAAEARVHLDGAGYGAVTVSVADGWDGYPSGAPYDRILITVGVQDIAPAWIEQLREGGVLVAPFSFGAASFTPAFRKRGQVLVSERISSCAFMDMRGKQPRQILRQRGEHLEVWHDALTDADLAAIDETLDLPAEPLAGPGLTEAGPAANDFFTYFLPLAHPRVFGIKDPRMGTWGLPERTGAVADLERRQLVLWEGFGHRAVCFGGPEIGEEVRRLLHRWRSLGRPGLDRLVMVAYPRCTYPHRDALPPGRWMGLVEKEYNWFCWWYRREAKHA